MKLHANASTCPNSRALIAPRVLDEGWSLRSAADADDDKDRATVSLTIDFLKPASPGDWIESRSRVERVGGTLAFADCSLTVDGREIVRARAVYAVAG